MGTELTVEMIESMALCAHYFAGMLDDIAHEYREKAEREKQEPKEERHSLDDLYERCVIDRRTWSAIHRGCRLRLNIDNPCLEDLSNVTYKMITRWSGVGKKTVADIKKVMDEYGVKFKGAE